MRKAITILILCFTFLTNAQEKITLPEIVGAGRTDSGVHAKQMFAHFDVENQIEKTTMTFDLKLNL